MMEKSKAHNIPIPRLIEILYEYYSEGVTHVDVTIVSDREVLFNPAAKKDDDVLNQLK